MFEPFRESKGTVPLILGVTGHRDLRPGDLAGLRLRIRAVLEKIGGEWREAQGEAAAPIYLLSGMAAGADQVSAEVAFEMGIGVVAVLPMPLDQYLEDFPLQDEKLHLKTLLDRVQGTVTLPPAGAAREAQYEAAGSYISRNCSLLLALWDGIHLNKVGGTSHVVRMTLSGADSSAEGPLPSLDLSTPGRVIHIPTPRMSSQTEPDAEIRILYTDEEGSEVLSSSLDEGLSLDETLRGQSEFNADWLRLAPKLASKAQDSARNFVPSPPRSDEEDYLRRYYGVADTLAVHFQRLSVRVVNWYFVLLLLAGVVLEGGYYYYPLEDMHWKVNPSEFAYCVLMLCLIGFYWYSKKKEFHNRYLEYRAFAEALRVQLFWRLAGLDESVANHYPAHQAGDMGWICKALHAVNLPLSPPQATDFPALRDRWIKDQLDYFKSSVKKNTRLSNLYDKRGTAALAVSIAWVFLRTCAEPMHQLVPGPLKLPLALAFVVLASTSVIAFVLFGYNQFRGFSQHAKRHLAMIPLYEMAFRLLSKPFNEDAARQVALQIGKEALAENGYWLVLHHQQELDLG